jgi:hypothetical protein
MSLAHRYDNAPNITIPEDAWQETGGYGNDETDTASRLLTPIYINGLMMHLEAYALVPNDDEPSPEQRLIDDEADDAFGKLVGECGFPISTVEIKGRAYVLIATPSGA